VPFTRQTLFFTATMPPEIRRITEQFLHNPVKVEVAKPATTVAAILQQLVKTGREPHDKRDTLRRTIRAADNFKNAIIFCNRKREVAQLHRSLVRHGFNAVALHGDLDQSARTAALDAFRSGEAKLLIASDVAARGLDIPDVSHVFNFDVPHHADDYVHRIGRTGRAGKTGTAYTIVGPGDGRAVSEIEKLIGQSIPWADALPGEPAQADGAAPAESHYDTREPRRDGRGGGGRHKQRGPRDRHRGPPREHHREAPRAQEVRTQDVRTQEVRHQETRSEPARSEPAQLEPRQPAPVARIEEARHRQAPARPREPVEPSGGDHLPAFLLRPVRGKA
jgi:superfamily II DNA/RNA helicase